MSFPDAGNGFVVLMVPQPGGAVAVAHLVATDDGQHWQTRSMPDGTSSECGIDFVSPSDGWTLVLLTGHGSCTQLFHTADGGRTWTAAAGPAAGPDTLLEGMRFASAGTGWIVAVQRIPAARPRLPSGSPYLFATLDGGATWQRQSLPPIAGAAWPQPLWLPDFPHLFDATHGALAVAFAPSGNKHAAEVAVYSTVEGGRSRISPRLLPRGLVDWTATDPRHWWGAVVTGVRSSTDGGATWSAAVAPPSDVTALDMAIESSRSLWRSSGWPGPRPGGAEHGRQGYAHEHEARAQRQRLRSIIRSARPGSQCRGLLIGQPQLHGPRNRRLHILRAGFSDCRRTIAARHCRGRVVLP